MSIKAEDIGVKEPGNDSSSDTTENKTVLYWIKQIEAALKREKDWRKEANDTIRLYEGRNGGANHFNILYSNTETMAPALFNSVPRPIVKRRYQDKDPLGMVASKIGERLLIYLLDDGGREGHDFNDSMEAVVNAALVPGRGIPWVVYDPVFETVPAAVAENKAAHEAAKDDPPTENPSEVAPAASERISREYICLEEVPWDSFLHGFAKRWHDVPWVAKECSLNKADCVRMFGAEVANRMKFDTPQKSEELRTADEDREDDEEKVAVVWQIWDKDKRKVLYVCREHKLEVLKELDDPLELDGFFPCPQPLKFFRRLNSLVPVTLYNFYKEQATELNRVTVRINKIMEALKVRGFYDQNAGDLAELFKQEENTLMPVQGAALAGAGGASGLDKSIWLMPLEKLITVLQQLYLQRQQIKTVIYEIMGLSDILRGSTQASETATAQEIKAEWGGLRLKRSQKAVQACVRDCLRIMLEVAVSKFPAKMVKAMTGVELPLAEEKQQMQMQAEASAAQGTPPDPALVAQLQGPSFEDALGLLQNDLQRKFRIDIETNSTIDAEATEDKKDIAEMMGAIGQFLTAVMPMVESGSMPFEAAQAMLLAIARRYRFGVEVEEKLMQMKQPEPKPDPKVEADKAKLQGDLKVQEVKMQGEQQKTQNEVQMMQLELQIKREELQLKREEMQLKRQEMELDRQFKVQQHGLDMQGAAQAASIKQREGEMNLQLKAQQGQMALKQKKDMAAQQGRQQSGGSSR